MEEAFNPMSEMRRDAVMPRWVIIAENRVERPTDFRADGASPRVCPFCEGSEHETPDEKAAYRNNGSSPNGPGWRVRSVPNRYPAVVESAESAWIAAQSECQSSPECDHRAKQLPAFGMHEVIIESPRHVTRLGDLTADEAAEAFQMYRDRVGHHQNDGRCRYALLFKNVGSAAGASLEHTHAQLVATPIVPPRIQEEHDIARAYRQDRGACLLCDMIRGETEEQTRLVYDDGHFVAWCPFASRFPFEVWLAPRRHMAHFGRLDDEACREMAEAMRNVIARLERVIVAASSSPEMLVALVQSDDAPPLPAPTASVAVEAAYNFIVHTGAFQRDGESPPDDYFHWHVEITPILARPAGFEWGTGIHINPVSPEKAAECLRKA